MEGRKMDLLGCRSHNNMKDGVASPSRRPFDPTRSQEKSLKSLREEIKSQNKELGNMSNRDLYICTRKLALADIKDLDYNLLKINDLIQKINSYKDNKLNRCDYLKSELDAFEAGRLESSRISMDISLNGLEHSFSFAEISTNRALEVNKEIYKEILYIKNYMERNEMDKLDKDKVKHKDILMNDGTFIEVKSLIELGKQVSEISKVHKTIIDKMETWEMEEKRKFTDILRKKKEPLVKKLIDRFEGERHKLLMLIEACKPKDYQQVNNSEQSNPEDQRVNNSKQSNPEDQRVNNSKQSNPEERRFRNDPIVREAVNHLVNTLLCQLSASIGSDSYVQHLDEAYDAQQKVYKELKESNPTLKVYNELYAEKEKKQQEITKCENLVSHLDGYINVLTSYYNELQMEIVQSDPPVKEDPPMDIWIADELSSDQRRRSRSQQDRTSQRRESGSSQNREERGRTPQRRESGSSQHGEERVRTSQRRERGSPEIEEWGRTPQRKGKDISQGGEESSRIPPNTWKNGKSFHKVMQQAGREEGVID